MKAITNQILIVDATEQASLCSHGEECDHPANGLDGLMAWSVKIGKLKRNIEFRFTTSNTNERNVIREKERKKKGKWRKKNRTRGRRRRAGAPIRSRIWDLVPNGTKELKRSQKSPYFASKSQISVLFQ